MRKIRYNTFETNSSSTHALIILSKKEYEDFCNERVALNLHNGKTVPLDKNIIMNDDGSYTYQGSHYDSLYDLICENIIDDEYATYDYIEQYADVEQKEMEDKIIMSIYRGDIW